MQFLVTEIKFDFNDDLDPIYSIPKEDQDLIVNDNLGVWEADDEDDLVEEILSLIHISEPTRPRLISYAVFCLKKKRIHINQKINSMNTL